jgi:hypothetical protein
MTVNEAYELLTTKYPKGKIKLRDISIDDENEEIEVWSKACEYNECGAACTDWFDFKGNHKGHKCK